MPAERYEQPDTNKPAKITGAKVFALPDMEFPIELRQNGFDRFTVVYGKSVKPDLSYADACDHLGRSILHALACAGRIDNRTKEDAREAGDRKIYIETPFTEPKKIRAIAYVSGGVLNDVEIDDPRGVDWLCYDQDDIDAGDLIEFPESWRDFTGSYTDEAEIKFVPDRK